MKSTKTILFRSFVALLLCFTMLLGTTYAWFTDSVSSVDNIIKAGTLDIAMYWNDDLSGNWKDAEGDDKIFDCEKWEPGYAEVRYVKVVNEGSLAFKYVLSVIPTGRVTKLADVIDVYFIDPAQKITDRAQLKNPVGTLADVMSGKISASGKLEEEGDEAVVTIALKMQETAGNEYQGLSIGDSFTVQLSASQLAYESDSFGPDYDTEAGFGSFGSSYSATSTVEMTNGVVTNPTAISSDEGKVSANVSEGTKVTGDQLKLTVTTMSESGSNITVAEDRNAISLDVHVEGIADDNTVPVAIVLKGAMAKGLNLGNHDLYHVENGQTYKMTYIAEGVTPAHNTYSYDPATGDVVLYMASFSEVQMTAAKESIWTGGVDYSWYATGQTRYTISNADQLVAFARIVGGMANLSTGTAIFARDSFAGKVVKLTCDIDLGWEGGSSWNGYPLNDADNLVTIDGQTVDPYFYPIGYYNSDGNFERTGVKIESGFRTFEGVFDGGGHTISNFYQNTWGMKGDNEYYSASLQRYRDGMGLFGRIYGGTVKNLTVDSFSSDGEYTTTGVIAAYADHGATFENIAITNCNPRVYNIGNGGIVGCAGWYNKAVTATPITFRNITVDNTNKISSLWGSYDTACGGILGQYYPTSGQSSAGYPANAGVRFEDCHVAAQLDVYNDVCGNYQYYAYRYAGILLGSVRENVTIDGRVYPKMDGITASGCTVHFGTWNDYYYCEFEKNGHPSYSGDDDYKFSRVPHSEINFTDTNDNGIIDTDAERASVTGCKHDHTEAEDNQAVYLPFNNLVTGYGWGVNTYNIDTIKTLDGVIDVGAGAYEESVEKFEGNGVASVTCRDYTLGELFAAKSNLAVPIQDASVYVSVKTADGTDSVTASLIRDTSNWENSTLKFSGEGTVWVTIQDYYYCEPTTIELTVESHESTDTFVGRVTKADDPNGVGYELWGCNACHEAVKVAANHELGHHFDGNGNCKCGATATESAEKITTAKHDFTDARSEELELSTSRLKDDGAVIGGRWALTSLLQTQYDSGNPLQVSVSKNNNSTARNYKLSQMMLGNAPDGKTVSKVYISFDISSDMVAENINIAEAVLFSFRTTRKDGHHHQYHEIELSAKMENSVLSLMAGDTVIALTDKETYTVQIEINRDTKEFVLSCVDGAGNKTPLESRGTLIYDLSDYLTTVFRSNDFNFMEDYKRIAPETAMTAESIAQKVGAIWIDNLVYECSTREASGEGTASNDCHHIWTATEIAGETGLKRYTCTKCSYYFTDIENEVIEFAKQTFDRVPEIGDNLFISRQDGGTTFPSTVIKQPDGTTNNMWELTGNTYFYTKPEQNLNFKELMSGTYKGDQVGVVELSFDFMYTGDISQLQCPTGQNMGLLYYQQKKDASTHGYFLLFDKNGENGTNGFLQLTGEPGPRSAKIEVNAGKLYTITLRTELATGMVSFYLADENGAETFVGKVSNAKVFSDGSSFALLLWGRPFYLYYNLEKNEGGNWDYSKATKYENFHIYLDNVTLTYEKMIPMYTGTVSGQ
jgi:predicted ribosomally synthesized peptide with SipW-like signal peptide